LLKEYLFAFPTENPYLFNSNGSGHIDEETVNRRLRDLAREADINVGKKLLSWHCFRKMLISTAKNLSVDPDIIKLIVGKAVKKEMRPYLNGVDVKQAHATLQTVLGINLVSRPETETETEYEERIEVLELAIVEQQKQLATQQTINQTLTKQITELTSLHHKRKQYIEMKYRGIAKRLKELEENNNNEQPKE